MKKLLTTCLLVLLNGLLAIDAMAANNSLCSSAGDSTLYEWIEFITINDTRYQSGNNNGYFEHAEAAVLQAGTNTLHLKPGIENEEGSALHWRIWVDLNKDGQLTTDEIVFEAASDTEIQGTFQLPETMDRVSTYLRVIMQFDTPPDACGRYTHGETEDLAISFAGSTPDFSYRISAEHNFLIRRNGALLDDVVWVFEKNGEVVLSRNAKGEMQYRYFLNTRGSNIRVWLEGRAAGSARERVSNIITYTPGLTDRFQLTAGYNFEVNRSGQVGDNLNWVIEKDGAIVLKRVAANELSYTYFNNSQGSHFRVWLEQFISGVYKRVSNTIMYRPGQQAFSLTIDPLFKLRRDGHLGDALTWVIEQDGAIVLERVAANELDYTYFNNARGSNFRVWLEMPVQGQKQRVSSVVDYAVPAHYPYSLSLGPNYRLTRSGQIGDRLTWVVIKDGEVVLQRNAANELSYAYFNYSQGSTYEVYLKAVGSYLPASNVVRYTLP